MTRKSLLLSLCVWICAVSIGGYPVDAEELASSSVSEVVVDAVESVEEATSDKVDAIKKKIAGESRSTEALPAEIYVYVALTIIYLFHIYFVGVTQRRISAENSQKEDYRSFRESHPPNQIWLFGLTALVLPLGTGLISIYFGEGGIWDEHSSLRETGLQAAHTAFEFSKAVFLLMITLEISYLLNLREGLWQGMLSGALIIDFVAFFTFTIIGPLESAVPKTAYLPFALTIGLVALFSSLITIFYARLFDQFSLGSKPPKLVTHK